MPEAMAGQASPAKAAVGDKPVFAYIASLPQPQRGIAEAVDALANKTLPDLQRSVKWGMAYYGVGDGWCFRCGGFAGHVKLMFINGTTLESVPPVTPVGMGKSTRGVELPSNVAYSSNGTRCAHIAHGFTQELGFLEFEQKVEYAGP
jgi:hypothetical protein